MSDEQAATGLSEFSLGTAWLHLATLWALAVALPLLQLYDESPEFLIARGNAWPDLPIFTVALLALPPSVMVGRLDIPWMRAVHGSANALSVLAGLVGWVLAGPVSRGEAELIGP